MKPQGSKPSCARAHRSCPDRSVTTGMPGSWVIHGARTAVPKTVNSMTSSPSSPPLPCRPEVMSRSCTRTPMTASAPRIWASWKQRDRASLRESRCAWEIVSTSPVLPL